MKREFLIGIMLLCIIAAFLLLFAGQASYYYASVLLLIIGYIAAALQYEQRVRPAAEFVLIALFCALAVAGRAVFFYLPSIKVITAIIILAGCFMGAGNGFIVGLCSGFISNFIFGQGPWTPWQMLCWGLIGCLAGLLFYKKPSSRRSVCLYGGLSVMLIFAAVMNPVSLLTVQAYTGPDAIIAAYIAGLPFDIVHCLSTIAFIFLLYEPLHRKMQRIGKKYGVFNKNRG